MENEVAVSGNVKKELGFNIGSELVIRDAAGTEYPYIISGFVENPPMVMKKDILLYL